MSWPEVTVIVAGITGCVGSLAVVMPYVRTRSDEERHAAALKAANARIDKLESALADRPRLPTVMGRRAP